MLHDKSTILAPDAFPELIVTVRRPLPSEWADVQNEMIRGNSQEAWLNLFISIATVATNDGSEPPIKSALADEWPNLTEAVFGVASEMAGGWVEGVNATRLDFMAILAAAERVAGWGGGGAIIAATPEHAAPEPTSADLDLANLAAKCAAFGLDAIIMRSTLACHPRKGAFRAYLIDDIGAFIWTMPGTSARSAYDRRQSAREYQDAFVGITVTCCAFPPQGSIIAIGDKLPAFMTTAGSLVNGMRGDVRVEVKKGEPASAKPATTS